MNISCSTSGIDTRLYVELLKTKIIQNPTTYGLVQIFEYLLKTRKGDPISVTFKQNTVELASTSGGLSPQELEQGFANLMHHWLKVLTLFEHSQFYTEFNGQRYVYECKVENYEPKVTLKETLPTSGEGIGFTLQVESNYRVQTPLASTLLYHHFTGGAAVSGFSLCRHYQRMRRIPLSEDVEALIFINHLPPVDETYFTWIKLGQVVSREIFYNRQGIIFSRTNTETTHFPVQPTANDYYIAYVFNAPDCPLSRSGEFLAENLPFYQDYKRLGELIDTYLKGVIKELNDDEKLKLALIAEECGFNFPGHEMKIFHRLASCVYVNSRNGETLGSLLSTFGHTIGSKPVLLTSRLNPRSTKLGKQTPFVFRVSPEFLTEVRDKTAISFLEDNQSKVKHLISVYKLYNNKLTLERRLTLEQFASYDKQGVYLLRTGELRSVQASLSEPLPQSFYLVSTANPALYNSLAQQYQLPNITAFKRDYKVQILISYGLGLLPYLENTNEDFPDSFKRFIFERPAFRFLEIALFTGYEALGFKPFSDLPPTKAAVRNPVYEEVAEIILATATTYIRHLDTLLLLWDYDPDADCGAMVVTQPYGCRVHYAELIRSVNALQISEPTLRNMVLFLKHNNSLNVSISAGLKGKNLISQLFECWKQHLIANRVQRFGYLFQRRDVDTSLTNIANLMMHLGQD